MLKSYIVVLGIYDENTTEQTILTEIEIKAPSVYEAHKNALLKCNLRENHTVLRITQSRNLIFDFQKGFIV